MASTAIATVLGSPPSRASDRKNSMGLLESLNYVYTELWTNVEPGRWWTSLLGLGIALVVTLLIPHICVAIGKLLGLNTDTWF